MYIIMGLLRSWIWLFLFLVSFTDISNGTVAQNNKDSGAYPRILVVVLTQPDAYHVKRAEAFTDLFHTQIQDIPQIYRPRLLLTHEHLVEVHGAWTILNLVPKLMDIHETAEFDWVFLCEEETLVNVKPLLEFLSTLNPNENVFLGRALHDKTTTIIHHFAFSDDPSQFAYPDIGAGFALSINLLKRLEHRTAHGKLKSDFAIDPKHEFALFVWEDGNGTSLTDVRQFCFADESFTPSCITSQPVKFPKCGAPIEKDELFVAVKTCKKFHSTRVPVVQATWAKQAEDIVFYSEEEDKAIPTVNIRVPNTERGHCGKTMAIIRRVLEKQHRSQPWWVLIADDDTIINLDRLRALLACYKHRHPVALGERYGFGLFQGRGYDYITGGGGMVFNLPAIGLLGEQCHCYSDDAPDDMTLGMCLRSIGIPVTHSRFFHQARPEDYSDSFLSNQYPVSFHKHWEIDPYKVFARLSQPMDLGNSSDRNGGKTRRDEL